MSNHSENEQIRGNELLCIFPEEEDKMGTDLLQMSNFFDVYIGKIANEMENHSQWELCINVDSILAEISSALKAGFDISKMGTLVADYSHFSQDIINGLKEGVYHIGQSREVAGNMRPAILDEKEQLVKFFTLKKAINPSEVLNDISTLSLQGTLRGISAQIEEVSFDINSLIDFERREKLSVKFINARDRIMCAISEESEEERISYLKEADRYLMEGLNSLYDDINQQIKVLSELKGPFASVKSIDAILTYINEDMQMIPRYVALRTYLFCFVGKQEEANRIISEYKYHLNNMSQKTISNGKYSALELIHMNYKYNKANVDFWITQPPKMLEAISMFESMIDMKNTDIYYISAEENADEE